MQQPLLVETGALLGTASPQQLSWKHAQDESVRQGQQVDTVVVSVHRAGSEQQRIEPAVLDSSCGAVETVRVGGFGIAVVAGCTVAGADMRSVGVQVHGQHQVVMLLHSVFVVQVAQELLPTQPQEAFGNLRTSQ